MPPGSPATSRTSQVPSASNASRSVFITVGAQWPIRSRFATLRFRSFRRATGLESSPELKPFAVGPCSELAAEAIGLVQVAAAGRVVSSVNGVEVHVLDLLDARVPEPVV